MTPTISSSARSGACTIVAMLRSRSSDSVVCSRVSIVRRTAGLTASGIMVGESRNDPLR